MATQNTRAEFRKKLLHLMIPISLPVSYTHLTLPTSYGV